MSTPASCPGCMYFHRRTGKKGRGIVTTCSLRHATRNTPLSQAAIAAGCKERITETEYQHRTAASMQAGGWNTNR
jgi:hypothetical protein